MELHDIVNKLTGKTNPVGETNEDKKRLTNLEAKIELIEKMLFEISTAAQSHDRTEASMKSIGIKARSFLIELLGRDFIEVDSNQSHGESK